MDLIKSYDFFNPNSVRTKIHIIGCGSVGSTIAENLARCGVSNMVLWDFDKVESHNIVNQMFRNKDIGCNKAEALKDILLEINPEIQVVTKPKGWQGEVLNGYIFLAVDSISLRKEIYNRIVNSRNVYAVFDTRTLLTQAQSFGVDWSDQKEKESFWNSMNFTDEEAEAAVPTTACGTTLGVATTVRTICAYCVNNFINFVKGEGIRRVIISDCFEMQLDAFKV